MYCTKNVTYRRGTGYNLRTHTASTSAATARPTGDTHEMEKGMFIGQIVHVTVIIANRK